MDIGKLGQLLGVKDLNGQISEVEGQILDTVAAAPSVLKTPIERILQAKSKRLRPILVFAFASMRTETTEKVVRSAAAIEMVHLASLVHDDVIDNAGMRWGIPTIHTKEGLPAALLVGDYLFATAFDIGNQVNRQVGSIISSTIRALCEGESAEIAQQRNIERSETDVLNVIQQKTASLLSAACRVGAICGGMNVSDITAASEYGRNFGMAFQLIDDVVDICGDPNVSEKPTGSDIREGVYTLPLVNLLQSVKGNETRKLIGLSSESSMDQLNSLLRESEFIATTLRRADEYANDAVNSLDCFGKLSAAVGLRQLPSLYKEYILQKTSVT